MLRRVSAAIFSCVLLVSAVGLTGQATYSNGSYDGSYTGGRQTRAMISGPIDEGTLAVLAGNTNPHATAKNDRGAVEESVRLDHMQLVLQRPPELEKQLESLLQAQQEKSSPQYHKWLTAAEFGERFGVSQSDVAKVTSWLGSHGFHVDSVSPSGMSIEFSGTAGQVKETFHTEIHYLEVDGVKHFSNMSDPRIPAALTSVVKGVHSLNDFMPHPMMKKRVKYSQGQGFYTVVPADLATIYNLNPAFAAGYTGKGQEVVVIEDSDVYSADDISTFRSTLGLSGYSGTFSQIVPSGSNFCSDPGTVPGTEGEATLDAEWAGASAPNASVVLAACADSSSTFGGLLALQNLINGSSVPKIVSISYGECEAENGATANQSYYNAYQQAASEGVSVFVSAGDEGAASCDADIYDATHGIGVSGFASTPYNVAVGGTDYADTYDNDASTYWSSTNSSAYGSALSYIPEIPWNDSCASQLLATYNGFSTTYGTAGFCNSPLGEGYYVSTASGSGGPSGCYSGSPSVGGVVGGSCVGQAKPSWQSVLGNPADKVRDVPDISLFAANGVWNHYYVFCDSDVDDGGSPCIGNPPSYWSGAGGTSFSSPILAGVQALINQATSSAGSGNPNPRYYKLGALEFGSSGSATCNSTLGNGVGSSCVFYDVTQGDMDVNCTGSYNCYQPSGDYGVLSTSNSAYSPAYGTQTGWDFATGLGTINAYNLIRDWNAVQTKTAVTSSTNTPTTGQSVTYTATVTPDIGSSETGAVTWSSNTGCSQSTISKGTATCAVTWSSGGSETVTASYAGDSNYAASGGSISQTVTGGAVVTVSPTSVAFNNTLVGSTSSYQLVTLTNGGTSTLTGISFIVAGSNPSSFFLPSNHQGCSTTLAAKASCTFDVAFKPTVSQSLSAQVQISYTGSGSPLVVSLKGVGVGGTFTLSPSSLSFSHTKVGSTAAYQMVTLQNTSTNSTITFKSFSITGTNASSFSLPSNHQTCTSTLNPGTSCTFDVAFTPTVAGTLSASVQIASSAVGSPQSLPLTGLGIGPGVTVSVSPASLTFGSTTVGATAAYQMVTLTNTGSGTLSTPSFSIGGTNASSFTLPSNHQTCKSTLASGASCTFDVAFTPTAKGALTGTVSIVDNATGSPQTVSLTGTGK